MDILTLISFFLFFGPAQASMAAWLVDVGTQLVVQDPLSGSLGYILSNGSSLSSLFVNHPVDIITENDPRNDTSLAGVGWYDGDMTWACVFYQNEQDNLIHTRLGCSHGCRNLDSLIAVNLSAILPVDVKMHPLATINAQLLNADLGIRVYFHDESLKIHEMIYQESKGWRHEGVLPGLVSSSPTLSAAVTTTGEMILVSLKDEHTLMVHETLAGTQWSSAPIMHKELGADTPLWKIKDTQLALVAHDDGSRSIFYIGADNQLHQITSVDMDSDVWATATSQPADVWPPVHPSNDKLTVATRRDSPSFHLYYHTTDDILAEIKYNGTAWTPATPVEGRDSTIATDPADNTNLEGDTPETDVPSTALPESSSSPPAPTQTFNLGYDPEIVDQQRKQGNKFYIGFGVGIIGFCIIISIWMTWRAGGCGDEIADDDELSPRRRRLREQQRQERMRQVHQQRERHRRELRRREQRRQERRRQEQQRREQLQGVVPSDHASASEQVRRPYSRSVSDNWSGENIEMADRPRARSF